MNENERDDLRNEHNKDIMELDHRLTQVECQTKSNTEEIKALDHKVDDLHRIATSVEIIANDMTHIKSDISEVKSGQEELKHNQDDLKNKIVDVENSSAKKKEKVIDGILEKLLWLLVGGIYYIQE